MSFEHCHVCEPPVRHPGCQSHCPYYAADKAKCEERRKARKEAYRAGDDFRAVRSFKQKRLKNLK
jgi:hypothetical protein